MRLAILVPTIPADLVESLETCGIRTDTDFLFSGTAADIFKRLPPNTVSLHDLTKYVALVAERAAAPGVRADVLLSEETHEYELTSGVTELDDLLGGFGGSRVLEISGDGGSGKTTFVLNVVSRLLMSDVRSGALWIDTTGGFSVERMKGILLSYDGMGMSTALERLNVSLVFDIDAAYDILDTLRPSCGPASVSEPKVRCVVIDTITPLLGPLLSAVTSRGHATMTNFMRQLRALAQTYAMTVFVINNTIASLPHNPHSAFSSTVRKPALGPSFTFLTDGTLWFSKYPDIDIGGDDGDGTTLHIAEVFKSKTSRSRTWCTFGIRQGILVRKVRDGRNTLVG